MSNIPNKAKKFKSSQSHVCEYCGKTLPSAAKLKEHCRTHTGQRPFSCNLCEYSAARLDTLQLHIRVHLQEKPYKCPELGCKYSASDKSAVNTHHKLIHIREKIFHCSVQNCSYKSVLKHDLTGHMKTHEENPDRPFKCHLCPYRATANGILKSHMINIHSDELENPAPSFKCPKEGCGYAGKTKTNYNVHLERHKEKTMGCSHPNCEYKTNLKKKLKGHMEIHNLDKRYTCKICDYSAHQSNHLTRHMRIHTKETPYKCKADGCSYQAKQSGGLNRHVRVVHEKIRPFKCPFFGCSYETTRKCHLKNHQLKRHAKG